MTRKKASPLEAFRELERQGKSLLAGLEAQRDAVEEQIEELTKRRDELEEAIARLDGRAPPKQLAPVQAAVADDDPPDGPALREPDDSDRPEVDDWMSSINPFTGMTERQTRATRGD